MTHMKSVLLLLAMLCAGITGCGTMAPSAAPAAEAPVDKANLSAITIHLAGDSTVMSYPATTTQEGWGQELAAFFIDKVTVNNQAQGGASIRTFQRSGRWANIVSAAKSGDYVLIQFGANDSGTVPGRHVDPAEFQIALGEMADEIRSKQAHPIFVTPTAFYQWSEGKQDNARLAPYAAACLKVGADKSVAVVDINARGVEMLNSIGQTEATPLYFPARGSIDKAHFLKPGAVKNAQFVADELKRLKSPLAAYVK